MALFEAHFGHFSFGMNGLLFTATNEVGLAYNGPTGKFDASIDEAGMQ